MARRHVLRQGVGRLRDLHQATVRLARAVGQADFLRRIDPFLDEKEKEIVRRGRNTKSHPPQHADVLDYRMSTGLEALFGYLYLREDDQRLLELFQRGMTAAEEESGR
jgi:ribonuclease-3 family protein